MKLVAFFLLLLFASGCGQHAKRDAKELDALLTTGRIDRIEFFSSEKNRTNVFSGEQAAALTKKLASTNRIPRSTRAFIKNAEAGWAIFYSGTNRLNNALHYVPDYDALSFGQYYFAFKGTNELRPLFE